MNKKILLFCNGLSGTGKTTFIEKYAIASGFHNLISATTRAPRDTEIDGGSYYFRDEAYFADREKFATYLFVNENSWKPGDKKWLYGIPEFEVKNHIGQNLVYDVIQPRYTRDLMNWFIAHKLDTQYEFYVAYFTAHNQDNFDIVKTRTSMKNDMAVRRANTCNLGDFHRAGVKIDFITRPRDEMPSINLIRLVERVAGR